MSISTNSPTREPRVSIDDLSALGSGLHRPECVLCTASGNVFAADWRGGVAHIRPNGSQTLYAGPAPGNRPLRPNGIALRSDGSFLVTDLSPETGGVFHLSRSGQVRPFVERVDGLDLPPTNFILEDAAGRAWITVSTRQVPRSLGYRHDNTDGFIALADSRGVRIVADGLGYTNEVAIDPTGRWLYVNETFARRLSRFPLLANGDLGSRQVVTVFGPGTFPDGLCFDALGHAWITSVVSNRVLRVAPDGRATTVLEDADESHVARVEAAYQAQTMGRSHLDDCRSRRLRNISSLAFGGPDLRTAHLGCLLGDAIETFRVDVAGHPPAHWNFSEPHHG